jgi:uncharacterized membrane protein
MMRAFWVIIFAVVAVSAHLAYILYAPSYQLTSRIGQAVARYGTNTLAVLSAEEERAMLGGDGATAVAAICAIDLTGGAVKLTARMPQEFWTLAIYGQDGKLMTALNERQTGRGAFELTLLPNRTLKSMIGGEAGDASLNDPWSQRMSGNTGLLVLTVNLPAAYMRARLGRELGQSRCAAVEAE